MPPAREDMLSAIMSRLNTLSPSVNVYRNVDQPGFDAWPFATLLDGGHLIDREQATDIERVTLEFSVIIGVAPDLGIDLGTAINQLHASVVVAVAANGFVGELGSVSELSMEGLDIGDEEGQGHHAVSRIEFECEYEQSIHQPNTIIQPG